VPCCGQDSFRDRRLSFPGAHVRQICRKRMDQKGGTASRKMRRKDAVEWLGRTWLLPELLISSTAKNLATSFAQT
jgi:hypothetical protein